MPYYKDAQQPMYAQQRVTPLAQEMFTPQYFQQPVQDVTNSITEFFTKYWWTILLVLIILLVIFYFWFNNKSGERIVEF